MSSTSSTDSNPPMQYLIETMSQLMSVCQQADCEAIKLPRIVVVGEQSAGKSSVLESFVGFDILPRGSGIVTRTPLQLTLIYDPNLSQGTFVGEFEDKPGTAFTTEDSIRREIEQETEKRAGSSKNVVDDPIGLTVKSPHVPNLIVVDLPGLTKNAVGDQPATIVKSIRDLVLKYITEPKTIILAVAAGNNDLANSDGLSIARQVDPEGQRTMCVITKTDLSPDKAQLADNLTGKQYVLKLGYVGVRLRSAKDQDMTPFEFRRVEEEFFDSCTELQRVRTRCGVHYLARSLSELLLQTVTDELPTLRGKVDQEYQTVTRRLKTIGDANRALDENQRPMILVQFLQKFVEQYRAIVIGGSNLSLQLPQTDRTRVSLFPSPSPSPSPSSNATRPPLKGGALLNTIFNYELPRSLRAIKADLLLRDEELELFIRELEGIRTHLYPPEDCFVQLVPYQVEQLQKPLIDTLDRCFTICKDVVREALNRISESERYPKLRQRVTAESDQLLEQCRKEACQRCEEFIQIQNSYINTNSELYRTLSRASLTSSAAQTEEQARPDPYSKPLPRTTHQYYVLSSTTSSSSASSSRASSSPDVEAPVTRFLTTDKAKEIRTLVQDYFNVVKAAVIDTAPKIIMTFLIRRSIDTLEDNLATILSKPEVLKEVVVEDPIIAQKRDSLLKQKEGLERCQKIIRDFFSRYPKN